MLRLRIYLLICDIAYLMVKHYDKLFNKWRNLFSKYLEKAEKINEEIN